MIGETISHYRVLEKLGRGGMGEVYKAEDTTLRRTVALKFLSPELTLDEDARTRFVHEAQAASALQHHNICTIHEIDRTADGRMFICMDYYGGATLKARIERGPLAVDEAVATIAQAAEGLAQAHGTGMIHRDIKPANIALTPDGVVKILDFGLAMLSDRTRVTKTGSTVGTAAYMSPEQARGEAVSPAADVWSLGVILYELLAGRLPFSGPHPAAVVYAIVNEAYEPIGNLRGDVPGEVGVVVDRALTKDPAGRYRDAGEMSRALREARDAIDRRRRAIDPTQAAGDRRGSSRRVRLWIPLALVVAIVAAFVVRPLWFQDEVVSAPRPVAVISFENRTGDPQYDYLRGVIPNLLITSLEQSKYLSVVTWERMHDLLEQSGHGALDLIDKEAGFEVCRMDGVDTIVLGSFAKAGDIFVTDVKVLDVQTKTLLKSASAKGQGVGSILESQVDELGREICHGVGLSERLIRSDGTRPIAAVTTRSVDAYDYFLRGKEALENFYRFDAERDLEKAVELDSSFAVAWLYLARAHSRLNNVNASKAAYERAMSLSNAAPEKIRLYIEAFYASEIEGDDGKSERLLLDLTRKYPKEKEAFFQLGSYYRGERRFEASEQAYLRSIELDPRYGEPLNGIAYLYAVTEDYERAIEYFERYAEVRPDDANPFDSMGEMNVRLGHLDEAEAMYKRAIEVRPDFGSERGLSYLYALRGDYAGAVAAVERLIDVSPTAGIKAGGRMILAFYDMYRCRWESALEAMDADETAFRDMGYEWGLVGLKWMEAWGRYLMGDVERSRGDMAEAVAMAQSVRGADKEWFSLTIDVMRAMNDIHDGDIAEARARLSAVEAVVPRVRDEEPERSESSVYAAALLRAEVLLAEGRVDESIEVGRSIQPPTMPAMSLPNLLFHNFPSYHDVLARAYVQKGALDDAIFEYERLVTWDPSRKDRRLVYPVMYYRLGLLYEEKGRVDDAVRQYERFLEIVGEAAAGDAIDARARIAALRGRTPPDDDRP